MTQEQYETVTEEKSSEFKGDRNPRWEQVSWDDAQEFCRQAEEEFGLALRLPTEAEWEYACRAGRRRHTTLGPVGGSRPSWLVQVEIEPGSATHSGLEPTL